MSVGSHFTVKGSDPRILRRAVRSATYFRKHKAPYFRVSYRKVQRGWTFWRIK